MLNGGIAKKLAAVALPLAAVSILQQLFNAADVAVVGRFASSEALAAVGANTPICNLFITFFTGLATGSNVAISTLIGRGDRDRVNTSVNTVFTLSLLCGLLALLVGELAARPLLTLISTPENILDSAVLYLRIYLFAVMFQVIYNFTSAILRSKGDTRRPLYCLIASGVLNVALNLLLVIVFRMGVSGVAIATLISNLVCAAASVVLLLREEEPFRLSFGRLGLDRQILSFALRIGLPAGLQAMLFSVSNIIIQSGINSFGADCIAGNTAAVNFEFISYFFVLGFSQAETTFISQNYGAGKYDRCGRIFRLSTLMGGLCCLALSLCFFFGSRFWIGLFTSSESVYGFAMVRMTCVVLLESLTTFNEMPAAACRSMGVSLPPTIISVLWACVFRIVWISTVFRAVHTITVLMLVYPVTWVIIGICQTVLYLHTRRRRCVRRNP